LLKNVDKEVVKKYLCDEAIAVKKYINSEVILSPETEDFFIGIVVCGTVEIFSTSQSHKVLLKTAGAGAMFGVANLYSEEASFPSKIISKGNTQILLISVEAFKALLENNSIAMKNFLSFMSQKVLYLNKKIASYTVGNNESKVAYFLLDNNVDGVVELNINLSDVAVMLDSETLEALL
jgi:CRP-like cAMP-binding protein